MSGGRAGRAARRLSPLTWERAISLGVLQGAAELLPISSSAHLELLPWLTGREQPGLEPELSKALETAVHGGAALALLGHARAPRWRLVVLATLPPAAAGVLVGPVVEQRLGGPASTAAGLAAGSVLMLLADRAPAHRDLARVGDLDAVWLGLAQAAALIPGVSRSGATISAARARGFSPRAARHLSDEVALPVLMGAAAWQIRRVGGRGLTTGEGGRLLIAGLAAAGSTAAAQRWLPTRLRSGALAPFAAYRLLLSALVGARLACRHRLAARHGRMTL